MCNTYIYSALYSVQSILYIVRLRVYNICVCNTQIYSALYSVQSILYTVQCRHRPYKIKTEGTVIVFVLIKIYTKEYVDIRTCMYTHAFPSPCRIDREGRDEGGGGRSEGAIS